MKVEGALELEEGNNSLPTASGISESAGLRLLLMIGLEGKVDVEVEVAVEGLSAAVAVAVAVAAGD